MGEKIEEIQGLYGPFSVSERVLQKIWLKQDFDQNDLVLVSGKQLEVFDPGRWNLLEGPDFKDAKLRIDGKELRGDVEIHFNAVDWNAHGHQADSNYDRVILHVLLNQAISPKGDPVINTTVGMSPETLILLPVLNRDLEAYATDEALLEMEQQDVLEWVAQFLGKPLPEREMDIIERGRKRWKGKLKFAQKRLDLHGWETACHQFALEVLGYTRNRAPMSAIALEYSIDDWRRGSLDTDELFNGRNGQWRLNGLRPANHPRLRLRQYAKWVALNPNWPKELRQLLEALPSVDDQLETAGFRRMADLNRRKDELRKRILNLQVGETRMNTMLCDTLFPLAAASGLLRAESYWLHWYPGDVPESLRTFLRHAGLSGRRSPISNGNCQGVLDLFLSRGEV